MLKEPLNVRRDRGRASQRLSRVGGLLLVVLAGLHMGCSAVYPETTTAVRPQAENAVSDPPAPEDLYYIYFESAWIPPKNPGGQAWPGGAPDPIASLLIDGVKIIETPTQSNTRKPTWPGQTKENLRIRNGAQVFVEVWDANPMVDVPICRAPVRDLSAIREGGDNEIWCDTGARVRLHVQPAKALIGIGLYYETRGRDGVQVTRVVAESPASRAGLGPGDRILAIQGKKVAEMDALQVRSEMNLHSRSGLELDVWFANGKRHLIKLKEGSLFPLRGDNLKLEE